MEASELRESGRAGAGDARRSRSRGDQSVDDLKHELAESRDQRAATAEILRAISSSPTDLWRMFAAVAASAARLCDAYDATIFQVDGAASPTMGRPRRMTRSP